MTFLQYMTKAIVSMFEEDKILKTVLHGIGNEIGYRRAAVLMADGTGSFRVLDSAGFPPGVNAPVSFDGNPAAARLFHGKETVILQREEAARPSDGDEGFQQQCLIPVLFREEVRGLILLDRLADEPPFSEERINLLATLSGQLGLALENARLYRTTLHLSMTDGLTGLYNARYFYERLETEMSRARR